MVVKPTIKFNYNNELGVNICHLIYECASLNMYIINPEDLEAARTQAIQEQPELLKEPLNSLKGRLIVAIINSMRTFIDQRILEWDTLIRYLVDTLVISVAFDALLVSPGIKDKQGKVLPDFKDVVKFLKTYSTDFFQLPTPRQTIIDAIARVEETHNLILDFNDIIEIVADLTGFSLLKNARIQTSIVNDHLTKISYYNQIIMAVDRAAIAKCGFREIPLNSIGLKIPEIQAAREYLKDVITREDFKGGSFQNILKAIKPKANYDYRFRILGDYNGYTGIF